MSKKTDLLSRKSLAKRERFWVNSWIDKCCQLLASFFLFFPERVPCKWKGRQDLVFLSINLVDTVRIFCVNEGSDHAPAGRTQSLDRTS